MYDYYDPSYYSAYSSSNTEGVESIIAFLLGLGILFWIFVIVLAIVTLVARWKLFKKANVGGWESLIPIHGDIVELQLGGVATYWYFLNLIVLCGIGPLIFSFWKSIALAKSFGKGTGFGVLLALFPFIAYPILAFGSSEYVGNGVPTPGASNTDTTTQG